MLDRFKLIREIQNFSDSLFIDVSDECSLAREVWQRISRDPTFIYKIRDVSSPWLLPSWSGILDDAIPVDTSLSSYHALSVDGSQIYPDRHQGSACYVINVGSVAISYGGAGGQVYLHTEPHFFVGDETGLGSPMDVVDCRRQEFEFEAGRILSNSIKERTDDTEPLVLLFDGSLIFWHLESKGPEIKEFFLDRYISLLHQLYEDGTLIAGYISLPKSKELVNLVRVALCDFKVEGCEAYKAVDHLVDATIANFFLKPFTRSIIFKNNTKLCALYPEPSRPHFFYLHVGTEIARIEIPAWIAQDEEKVATLCRVIIDQCTKGHGYPVVLAEAHEQAVVKGPDRDFFYHLITKIGIEQKQRISLSQKSVKKRGIGI